MYWLPTINSTTSASPFILQLTLFKIEDLILRFTEAVTGGVLGNKVFLEITVAIFENVLKINLKLPCESVDKIPKKIPVKKFSFSKFAGFQCIT